MQTMPVDARRLVSKLVVNGDLDNIANGRLDGRDGPSAIDT
jgi:hypothetical protein